MKEKKTGRSVDTKSEMVVVGEREKGLLRTKLDTPEVITSLGSPVSRG